MSNELVPVLTPLLVVRDAPSAIAFYVEALCATVVVRYDNPRTGTVSHADLTIGRAAFSLTEEARAWNSDAPPSLGGTPVVLQLRVSDVRVALDRMQRAGAETVYPLTEFCGDLMTRVRDPFGHVWLLSERTEELTTDEIRKRRAAWLPPGQSPKT